MYDAVLRVSEDKAMGMLIAILLGFFGVLLMRRSLLWRQGGGDYVIDKMCADNIQAAANCCASCGTAEVDDVKLKKCDQCDLVRYCSVTCQQEHQPQHEVMCKKRAAELRDEILFRQPESTHLGDCPICLLPLSPSTKDYLFETCCSKIICRGCDIANKLLREREGQLRETCPFCRHPQPKTPEEQDKNIMKRAAANDSFAIRQMGMKCYREGDYEGSFKYLSKAAELGDVGAHHFLGALYLEGKGVKKDYGKAFYCYERAAIGGHPRARYNLGLDEGINERYDRAVKHFIIAATLGNDDSIQRLKHCYTIGKVSKTDFAAALRAHQAAVDAMKSPQREAAKEVNYPDGKW